MNFTKATSVARFILLLLVIATLLAFSICGVYINDDAQLHGIFDEGTIRLGLDLAGGSSITYQAKNEGGDVTSSGMNSVLEVMRNRLDNAGFTEALVYLYGDDMIVVELPSVEDPSKEALNFMQTAKLEFKVNGEKTAALTGDDVAVAYATYQQDQKTGDVQAVVNLEFTVAGAKKFAEATKNCALTKKTLDIFVDGVCISSPTVSSEYASTGITGGKAVISGGFATLEEAEVLANNIDAGALQYDLEQVSMESVKASLGEDALKISLMAGAIGLLLVMAFMAIYYRTPGVWASVSLVAYAALFFLVLAIGQFNLTLTGIAGIILSIGMAVDANVIIFERMKEELYAGKSVKSAIKSGYKRALWAILDSNVTTMIACAVLYIFGSGTIKGFALTLGIGVIISMFTALVISRVLLNLGVGMGIINVKAYLPIGGGKKDA
ncbi:MAG: protein translocase subunit SecD [Clostridia bacterium]|nr:protein translocase subunit SecD [Clostridia bacterium]